ncbi:MAG: Sec-independent periplasmic protein translocase [uncultured bacterium]|nr:MAG: Sec-independent periplasmic protein translocase [uncultured bacterium]HBH18891.1 hypothetical protein [Cyanobacteria bacterium UBA9579]
MKQCVKEDFIPSGKSIYLNFDNTKKSKSVTKNNTRLKIAICYSCLALLVTFTLGLLFSGNIIKILQLQLPFTVNFLQSGPDEIFVASLRVATFIGLYLAFPVVAYQFARIKFDNKGENEKSFLILASVGFILFTFGILFAYYALIPSTLFFLLGFNSDVATASFSISKYVSFCLNTILIGGIIFESPVFLGILAKTNLITYEKLISSWKKVAIGTFAVSIILTSTELFTQIFLAITLLTFYGIGLATTKIIEGDNIT